MGESVVMVVPDHVLEAGRFVREVSSELMSGLDSVAHDVNQLLETWNGRAADAYEAGWSDVQVGACEILDALAGMSELLGATTENYQRAELNNAEHTSVLNGLL
ncbi:WXG100 family type VII secretion target [Rhodococcus sp. P1Y]|uniref:WXG100 family type VII secretion target n=1 Tax=Rhodococcus sp. P1Y TaxID=1302308 RepID=UPI000EB3B6E9|nr:WXG100 family type VII secretion target [Rhodococcus sp. P1Y]AYJ50512.1 WXG100 family type VII secretion target [Rhodococcus sp. P1Y]